MCIRREGTKAVGNAVLFEDRGRTSFQSCVVNTSLVQCGGRTFITFLTEIGNMVIGDTDQVEAGVLENMAIAGWHPEQVGHLQVLLIVCRAALIEQRAFEIAEYNI